MQRFPSLSTFFAAIFIALFSTSCIQAQAVNETATIVSIGAVTTQCAEMKQVCSGITAQNVGSQGVILEGEFGSTIFAVHQIALTLELSAAGDFSDANAVVLALEKFGRELSNFLETLTEKTTILVDGKFKNVMVDSLVGMQAVVDAMFDEVARRCIEQNESQSEVYQMKDALGDKLTGCIKAFNSS